MSRHFEALAHRKDGSFALAGSSLTGNTWDGSLWYFTSWDHYTKCPNLELDAIPTPTGHSDIEWFQDSRLIVASDSGDLEVWHIVSPGNMLQCDTQLDSGHNDMVLTVCVTGQAKDGHVVSGGADGRIIVWDITTAKPIHRYRGHIGWVNDIAAHPLEPNLFISTSMDKQIKVWDIRQSSPVTMSVKAPRNISCQSLAWQNDIVAGGDESGYLHIHDLRDFTERSPLSYELHSLSIQRLSFSPLIDGLIASISDDSTSKLFFLTSSSVVCTHKAHTDFVRGLSWDLDSYLTCSWDGNVYNNTFDTSILPSLTVTTEQESNERKESWERTPPHDMMEQEEHKENKKEDGDCTSIPPGKQVAVEPLRNNGSYRPSRLQAST